MKKYLLLPIYFLIIALFVINYDLGYTLSLLLYFLVPSIYFSIKNKAIIKKTLFYSFVFSMPAVFIFDYMAHVSNSWYVPSQLGIRVLNTFPLEEILWAFLYFYIIIISYETLFVEKKITQIFARNTKYLIRTVSLFFAVFISIFLINKELLILNYFYIGLVTLMMALPSIIVLYFHPQHVRKILSLSCIFLVSFLIYEYSALVTEQWFFNGNYYIGWMPLVNLKMPIEELLFMIFSVPGTISLYELFSRKF